MLSALPIGRFTLTITHPGFSDLRIADVDLNSGVTRTLDPQLQVASAQQTVQVEGDRSSEELDQNDAIFGGTIQSVQVAKLAP